MPGENPLYVSITLAYKIEAAGVNNMEINSEGTMQFFYYHSKNCFVKITLFYFDASFSLLTNLSCYNEYWNGSHIT